MLWRYEVVNVLIQSARKNRITAYLELAVRRQLPLATLDDDLRKAAVASGVSLLEA